MRNFEYYTPTQVLFGKDTHLQAGSLLKKYGAKKSSDPLWRSECCPFQD